MRIGVVGAAGKIGQLRVGTVQGNPDTTLVALCDLDRTTASAVAPGVPVYSDLTVMPVWMR